LADVCKVSYIAHPLSFSV